ncbi:MBL fold metallo-hydrolase [Alkalicoccus urumqiensis]|uniref:Metallo-beta-lactamase domain-containing protein n=1 Tax=Alkalicoccus urumqiensis TaxID=1548213 RepID=A0A2P6MGN2_ALKUR|nr:MBL fold metallo-hydrolase [Alkalicoccus urumqiensis]PRO65427.1 hypothetical protein C6I21_09715 [Alkalicoccus urumqiensis]
MTAFTETESVSKIRIPTPFAVGDVNVYVIHGEKETILVDTGPEHPESWKALEQGLKDAGTSPENIDRLILTHHHPDHIGMAWRFPTARIYGHGKLVPWIEKDQLHYARVQSFFREFFAQHGMPPEKVEQILETQEKYRAFVHPAALDGELSEGDLLPGLQSWNVIETPGHAQTHLSFIRTDGVCIAGDHLIEHISSNAIMEAPYEGESMRPRTLLQYRETLQKISHAKTVLPGHGNTIDQPEALINTRLNDQLEKAEMFLQKMGGEPVQAAQLAQSVYKRVFEKQPDLTFSETLGHLDLLKEQDKITMELEDGHVWYQAAHTGKAAERSTGQE